MSRPEPKPSFSPYRRWGIGLRVVILVALVFSVVVMVNYLSHDPALARKLNVSTHARDPLSERTVRFVQSITNQVRVTVYYDRDEAFFTTVADLLNEYKAINPRISIRVVDYLRDPGAAEELRVKYPFLSSGQGKNLVIFDCEGRTKLVDGNSLTKYILEQIPSEKDREYRRKPVAFEGEKAFTSTLIAVSNPKPLKAYFLAGHGEHDLESGDEKVGFLKLAALLRQNYIQVEKLTLLSTNVVPLDCNLLVIAGPVTPIPDEELKKIEAYLEQGGRMLALFNALSLNRGDTGLERILEKWNIGVTSNIIKDQDNTLTGFDMKVLAFSKHPIVNPLLQLSLHLVLPREIRKLEGKPPGADSLKVEEIAFSGPKSVVSGQPGGAGKAYPLIVAAEKGAIKGVITERGTTRMVVAGDSIFLANRQIDSAANRDFATSAANWLLDRTELLEGLGPRSIVEFRLAMTASQLRQTRWVLLGALPGGMLLIGCLVWFRRRK